MAKKTVKNLEFDIRHLEAKISASEFATSVLSKENESLLNERQLTANWIREQCDKLRDIGVHIRITLKHKTEMQGLAERIDNVVSHHMEQEQRISALRSELCVLQSAIGERDAEIQRLKVMAFDRFIDPTPKN